MSSSVVKHDARARDLVIGKDSLSVYLADGRVVSVPLAWFPKLLHASVKQRKNWRWIGDGEGIRWPDADEDLSVVGLLAGTTSPSLPRSR